MLLPIDQLERSAARAPELSDTSRNAPAFDNLVFERIVSTPETEDSQTAAEKLAKRKEMLETVSPEPLDFAFERAIGNNDAVYSNFVDLIESVKQKVGKIVIKDGTRTIACATGFMVSEQLLLTNWHVFNRKEDVRESEVEFFYEYDIKGDPKQTVTFLLDAETFFFSSKALDYCMVAVRPVDVSGQHPLSDIGYLFLDPSTGKLGIENEEKLNIIHHPDGDYKQLSIRENLFVKRTNTTIWYKTDTAQGSSGSPVFNDQWQVVALHHMGVAQKDEQGRYIDKSGNPIPIINGKIDATKIVWIANEGIRISVLLADFFTQFPENKIAATIRKSSLPSDSTDTSLEATPQAKKLNATNMEPTGQGNAINISFPSSLMNDSGNVTISITSGTAVQKKVPTEEKLIAKPVGIPDEELLIAEENKRLEDETDYSACKGYQMNFLGSGDKSIPMPEPKEKIRKFVAKLIGSTGIVLKYYNYSTIFHSVRMMPLISCVNVAGDPGERKNKQKRQDNWLRDSRLSFDIQLDDAWYKRSGFDRGHMTRREDANWGVSAEDAMRNANLTCMYTNACPQVAKLNRPEGESGVGLWGKLEQVVLEKGVEKEVGRTSKATVFNGPIFQDDDPVYKGIQVPMDFFKIVLWRTDGGELKATAFRLSQQELVSDIDFEQLDIDQNTTFKEYQVSIKKLSGDTNIDFSKIEGFDTFEGDDGATEISEESLRRHIAKHNKPV